jgi:hypothetical protein
MSNNLNTVKGAIEMVRIKSNAINQGLRSSPGMRTAAIVLWQATLAIIEIPIKRKAFLLAK